LIDSRNSLHMISDETLRQLKAWAFSDKRIARFC
jgi:hypothetical protein